ncbi:MAG: phytanoyl-CoA dioxygenase family protein [Planctomycetota bacterium]|jgi:hypothetical protein|nr:phytanoyl-CoA dioxygenase family protein [Planctomycetota bacterium]
MTDEELFVWDINGFHIIRGALDDAQIASIHDLFDENHASSPRNAETTNRQKSNPIEWGPAVQELIDYAPVFVCLERVLGPNFRLDHDYCMDLEAGKPGLAFHGDNSISGSCWYRCQDGMSRSGLTAVIYCLTDAGPEDGGFMCIPGSHKSNFPSLLPEEVLMKERHADYILQPEVNAGDVIIFTEALMHATRSWKRKTNRRALFLKYCPGHGAYYAHKYADGDYSHLTERQRQLLRPPGM